jgi:hypothetical protein
LQYGNVTDIIIIMMIILKDMVSNQPRGTCLSAAVLLLCFLTASIAAIHIVPRIVS